MTDREYVVVEIVTDRRTYRVRAHSKLEAIEFVRDDPLIQPESIEVVNDRWSAAIWVDPKKEAR